MSRRESLGVKSSLTAIQQQQKPITFSGKVSFEQQGYFKGEHKLMYVYPVKPVLAEDFSWQDSRSFEFSASRRNNIHMHAINCGRLMIYLCQFSYDADAIMFNSKAISAIFLPKASSQLCMEAASMIRKLQVIEAMPVYDVFLVSETHAGFLVEAFKSNDPQLLPSLERLAFRGNQQFLQYFRQVQEQPAPARPQKDVTAKFKRKASSDRVDVSVASDSSQLRKRMRKSVDPRAGATPLIREEGLPSKKCRSPEAEVVRDSASPVEYLYQSVLEEIRADENCREAYKQTYAALSSSNNLQYNLSKVHPQLLGIIRSKTDYQQRELIETFYLLRVYVSFRMGQASQLSEAIEQCLVDHKNHPLAAYIYAKTDVSNASTCTAICKLDGFSKKTKRTDVPALIARPPYAFVPAIMEQWLEKNRQHVATTKGIPLYTLDEFMQNDLREVGTFFEFFERYKQGGEGSPHPYDVKSQTTLERFIEYQLVCEVLQVNLVESDSKQNLVSDEINVMLKFFQKELQKARELLDQEMLYLTPPDIATAGSLFVSSALSAANSGGSGCMQRPN